MLWMPPDAITGIRLALAGHGGLDVAALHHAVLGDVGVDDRRDAIGLETAGQIDGLHAGDFRPAIGGDEAVLGVQTDDHLAREGAARPR